MRFKVIFEIEVTEEVLCEAYIPELGAERAALLRNEIAGTTNARQRADLAALAWDLVVGKNLHGVDADERTMTVEIPGRTIRYPPHRPRISQGRDPWT